MVPITVYNPKCKKYTEVHSDIYCTVMVIPAGLLNCADIYIHSYVKEDSQREKVRFLQD